MLGGGVGLRRRRLFACAVSGGIHLVSVEGGYNGVICAGGGVRVSAERGASLQVAALRDSASEAEGEEEEEDLEEEVDVEELEEAVVAVDMVEDDRRGASSASIKERPMAEDRPASSKPVPRYGSAALQVAFYDILSLTHTFITEAKMSE